MAKSGTIPLSVTGDYGNVTGWISWQESDIDAVNNTSKVTAKLHYANGWSTDTYSSQASPAFYLTINGNRKESSAGATIAANSSDTVVLTHTVTVTHGVDGSKSITISGGGGLSGTSDLRNSSGSGTAALTSIPRATTPSVPSSADIGTKITIGLARASSSYFHRLWWRLQGDGEDGWVQIGNTHETSCEWTPDMNICSRITGAESHVVELYCGTYNGNVLVGTNTVTMTLKVPSSVKPTATMTVEIVNDNNKLAEWGVAVVGYSKLRFVITGDTSNDYGATIVGYWFEGNGETIKTKSGSTKVLASATGTCKGWVQDSRGRWSPAVVKTVTVYNYSYPEIVSGDAYRVNAEGQKAADGEQVLAICNGKCSAIGENAVTVKWRWRQTDGYWSAYDTISNNTETILPGVTFEKSLSYEVELSVWDSLENHKELVFVVPTDKVVINLKKDGIGIGKYVEHSLELELEEEWDFRYHGEKMVDHVVDRGTDGIWTWEKWASGKAVCWGYDTIKESLTTASGAMYYGAAHSARFPYGLFTSSHDGKSGLQSCQISVDGNALLWYGTSSTYEHTQTYYLANPVKITTQGTFYVYYHAIGWWR